MTQQGIAKRVAFVASGGGAKGLAHLGVLKACQEAGIDIDVMVGTSAGSMACAFIAADVSLDVLIEPFGGGAGAKPWGDRRSPLPLVSRPNRELFLKLFRAKGVLETQGIESFMREALPCNSFEELPRDLHVVTTDLASSERRVFERGTAVPVSEAVAASMALPVVFRPRTIMGRDYMDGSISRTFSLDVACEAGADLIIASMVHSPFRRPDGFPYRGFLRIAQQAMNTMARDRGLLEIELVRERHPEVSVVLVEPAHGNPGLVNAFNGRVAWEQIVSGYAAGRRALRGGGLLGHEAHEDR